MDWRMNALVISLLRKLKILFYLDLNYAFDAWHSVGPAFHFPSELEYKELARLESNNTGIMHGMHSLRHMMEFHLKVSLYFLIHTIGG